MTRNIGTILVRLKRRSELKEIGKKGQTYDEVISELLDFKRKYRTDSSNDKADSLQSIGTFNSRI